MANKRINIASLEFDQIKENLKEFLRGQSQFSDYDFEGSNMSVLLDVLAYNTQYNALYMNMTVNEAYMDSASKRDSVVSLARGLGYTPRSALSARTRVNFTITPPNTGSAPNPFVTMPKNTPFNGMIDSERFTFYTTKDTTIVLDPLDQVYYFEEIELVEGAPISNRLQYTEDNRYLVPNPNIDFSTLKVRIQDTGSSTSYRTFTPANFNDKIDSLSEVYFYREIDNNFYEINFGDGILGKALIPGNVVNLEYFVSNGSIANGIRSLTYGGQNISGGTISNVVTLEPTGGGGAAESIEEIRFNAPNLYAAQNRAVTASDYEAILLNKVPSLASVIVWGGENNNPPIYGKVFISATTSSGVALTFEQEQDIIENVVDRFKVLSVIPEFRDPEYLRIELDAVVYFDATLTQRTVDDIDTLCTQLILDYNTNELAKFNRIFRPAQVARLIDQSDPSVISSVLRTKLYKEVAVVYGAETKYNINISNPIEPGSLSSSQFFKELNVPCYLYDNGVGTVLHYQLFNGEKTDLGAIGTINYETGVVSITVNIITLGSPKFDIIVRSTSPDIVSAYNQVVSLDTALLKVNAIVDDSTRGRTMTGNKFVFTSNKI